MTCIDILNFFIKYIPIVGFYFTILLNAFISFYIITASKEYGENRKK